MMDANSLYKQLGIEKDLVTDFTILFSRFEYALKRTNGYAKGNVEPDWCKFAKDHKAAFHSLNKKNLNEAVDYLKENPPKKQILRRGKLDWEDVDSEETLNDVLLSVRRVRNNLFHGGKFISGPVTDPSRDSDLLKSCMVVLEECLSLNNELHRYFFTDQYGSDISLLRP